MLASQPASERESFALQESAVASKNGLLGVYASPALPLFLPSHSFCPPTPFQIGRAQKGKINKRAGGGGGQEEREGRRSGRVGGEEGRMSGRAGRVEGQAEW